MYVYIKIMLRTDKIWGGVHVLVVDPCGLIPGDRRKLFLPNLKTNPSVTRVRSHSRTLLSNRAPLASRLKSTSAWSCRSTSTTRSKTEKATRWSSTGKYVHIYPPLSSAATQPEQTIRRQPAPLLLPRCHYGWLDWHSECSGFVLDGCHCYL